MLFLGGGGVSGRMFVARWPFNLGGFFGKGNSFVFLLLRRLGLMGTKGPLGLDF